jgi:hypothetical protein
MDVRATVASNPRTPGLIVSPRLGQELGDQEAVARNLNLSESILEELSCHWSWRVREAVAQNPRTTMKTLEQLAEDPDQSVQKAAKRRIKTK